MLKMLHNTLYADIEAEIYVTLLYFTLNSMRIWNRQDTVKKLKRFTFEPL